MVWVNVVHRLANVVHRYGERRWGERRSGVNVVHRLTVNLETVCVR